MTDLIDPGWPKKERNEVLWGLLGLIGKIALGLAVGGGIAWLLVLAARS